MSNVDVDVDVDGFTLVEILVVITIISILAGLSVVGVNIALKSGQVTDEEMQVRMLAAAIKSFNTEWGDYPPTTLEAIKISGNTINQGDESLFAHLEARRRGGPFVGDLPEERWQNYDGDELTEADLEIVKKELDWVRSGNKLLEYTDRWQNPYVYVHWRDYGKKFRYQDLEGNIFVIEAAKNPATGGYSAPTSFQLWSIGYDGVNQNGGGDDICSWK